MEKTVENFVETFFDSECVLEIPIYDPQTGSQLLIYLDESVSSDGVKRRTLLTSGLCPYGVYRLIGEVLNPPADKETLISGLQQLKDMGFLFERVKEVVYFDPESKEYLKEQEEWVRSYFADDEEWYEEEGFEDEDDYENDYEYDYDRYYDEEEEFFDEEESWDQGEEDIGLGIDRNEWWSFDERSLLRSQKCIKKYEEWKKEEGNTE